MNFFQSIGQIVIDLLQNHTLLAGLLAWLCAQVVKNILISISLKRLNFRHIFSSGGMPSSHSCCICAVTVMIGKVEGFSSPLFALAVFLSAIVMVDATGVRRATGEQAKILNKLLKPTADRLGNDPETEGVWDLELKEYIGHTPLQVVVGMILGILIGTVFPIS